MFILASVLGSSSKQGSWRNIGMLQRAREAARMALGQDDDHDYECARG
jgi:hypothetical protein